MSSATRERLGAFDAADAPSMDGLRACVHCGAEHEPLRPVEAWSELSSQLFECVDSEACDKRVAYEGR